MAQERYTIVPDGRPLAEAVARTTHMGIVAHPDDLEILAYPGILDCLGRDDRWFLGVVATDGRGSARSGPYAQVTDADMRLIRQREQEKAAAVGEYGAVVMLDRTSADVQGPGREALVGEIADLLRTARPQVVYTHSPADRHPTHVAVALAAIAACRALPAGERPARVLGGEVWGDLEWLSAGDKVAMDVSGRDSMGAALMGVFESQILGGKRYDLAVPARRLAHATYHDSHSVDASTALCLAMDLTPLVADAGRSVADYVQERIDRFAADVRGRIERLGGEGAR
jgi:LmbE family N-acetylglucosaminyl deacetylase